ncbi:MAG TPA: type I DNA topoisomerase [Alphaproteobacteria bacterium]|jgi:DNA topoisomerase-1|nr:type I DNA topoisomerase [Alphaproteobacteria bacterium]
MKVVVVESPAKAKTINKYLGDDFRVLASYGHIRDLPSKDGSVKPDQDFAMEWEIDSKAERHVAEIAKALKHADHLYLATDPDREGEAISWHVQEVLKDRKALEGVEVARVVFNEVTKDAVLEAMRNPRPVNRELVDAYLARRALDYLVGFTLSPVLWRKLPGARSAGRVQSVALRLICEREAEVEVFRPREYWTVDVEMRTAAGTPFTARLVRLGREKLDKFALPDRQSAENARDRIAAQPFRVAKIERKQVKRNPFPPFTTSTLQQEGSRKLGLGAARTMRIAQRLYEGVDIGGETVGLITYMRTDSVHLSREAMTAARAFIARDFGETYVPEHPRQFRATAKNAQEAHEAIRPTDIARRPEDIARHLDHEHLRLYELIWKRAVASQMESATLEQVAVDIAPKDDGVGLRANGQMILFDGFLRLYREDRDEPADEEEGEGILPKMAEGEDVARDAIKPDQHFTQPPPRYSEASLVKKLEELGIGRPSTYASIIQVLQDRKYVRLEKKRFIPEDRGRVVIAFLANFFERYVQYDFTADLENRLDEISNGRIEWKTVLTDFWRDFIVAVNNTKHLTIRQVLDTLDQELGPHFFPESESGKDPRLCPACGEGRLGLKLGKYGAFLGCSRYPDCTFTRPLAVAGEGNGAAGDTMAFPKELGTDSATGAKVSLRKGPYGCYVQLGEATKTEKPKRASLPKGVKPEDVTLEDALRFLSLPREVGAHPETGKSITAGLGRFGPYLKHDDAYQSLGADDDVLTIGLNRAVAVLKDAKPKTRHKGRELGKHPEDNKPVTIHSGKYGPYVAHNKLRASLPKDAAPDSYSLDEAIALLAARAEAMGSGKPKKPAGPAKAKKPAKSGGGKPKKKAKSAAAAPRDDAGGGE